MIFDYDKYDDCYDYDKYNDCYDYDKYNDCYDYDNPKKLFDYDDLNLLKRKHNSAYEGEKYVWNPNL